MTDYLEERNYKERLEKDKRAREDARRAFMEYKGYRTQLPIEEFENIVNWKDYPIDEPAINS